ncbi:MAG: SpoIIE family protein phosphatase [bacterium]|nr:SpoIIE family protein phosphatase [bacterium]
MPDRILALSKSPFTIGEDIANDLSVKDHRLSQRHAIITYRRGTHYLLDLESNARTHINDAAVRRETALKSGDKITLGDLEVRFLDPITRLTVAESPPPISSVSTVAIGSDKLVLARYQGMSDDGFADHIGTDISALFPALSEVAAALISDYELDDLGELLLDLVLRVVPAERAALLLRISWGREEHADGLKVQATRGFEDNAEITISRTIIREVCDNKKAILTLDAQADLRFRKSPSILFEGIGSIICVPLWNNQEVMGMIYLDTSTPGHSFTKSNLRLSGFIANMAAIKIDNTLLLADRMDKKRIEDQLAVGAEIQRKLLPQNLPAIDGYEISGTSESCFEVGGDYYDFIEKGDGSLAVVIADISGKGIGAALLMAALQASVRALIFSSSSPAELAEQLNRVLLENSTSNRFATMFYAEIDTESHAIEYVNCGHNPVLLAGSGATELLQSTGPVIGLLEDARFGNGLGQLEPGGLMLLYTDGIVELTNEQGEEYGGARLISHLEANRTCGGRRIIQAIRDSMDLFSHSDRLSDDTTLVVIKRC